MNSGGDWTAAVAWTIVAFQIFIFLVIFGLVFRRALFAFWARYTGRRKLLFQPHVLNLLDNPLDILPLSTRLRPFDKDFIEELLLLQAAELEGKQREEMTAVFEKLGYVAREKKTALSSAWWHRNDSIIKLGIMRSHDAVPTLINAVHDKSETVRLSAVRSLGQMKYREGLKTLLEVMGETGKWTGPRVLEILAGTGDLLKADVLSLLPSVAEPRHSRLLIELCGIKKWPESFPFLIPFLNDAKIEIRISVVGALSGLGVPAAGDYLVAALKDPVWEVRSQAAKGLGILQYTAAAPALLISLGDPNWWVRFNSANALSNLGAAGIASLQQASREEKGLASGMAAQVLAEQNLYMY